MKMATLSHGPILSNYTEVFKAEHCESSANIFFHQNQQQQLFHGLDF